ncbi:SBBP repeat-containing protein [Emticicia agri]|uniref:Beta-propeller repeat protein n=1 Tax=Emticicia agri TaxID=2492393 RepID=A0A4Q5LXF1_9BACT|nr:SBBP repeat-containing protein [Emticicia agri]RYU94227.1 hypothetical protein EWM59_18185 [Emticicia agri]
MKSLLRIFTISLLSMGAFAQSVTILPSGITPATASTIPTLTNEQIEALPSPAFGTLVNDITFKCFRFYDGKSWAKLLTNKDAHTNSMKAWEEGGSNMEKGMDIGVDANGNIFVTGVIHGSSKFGTKVILGPDNDNVFLAKYDKNGTFLWARTGGGNGDDEVTALAIDKNGNVYLTGRFEETATFGNYTVESGGNKDIFIIKYNTNGDIEWLQKAGGTGNERSRCILTNAVGDIYVTGNFQETAFFNGQSAVSAGEDDIFLAKYSSAGVIQWVKRVGGIEDDDSKGLAIDGQGNLYMTGGFRNVISFGTTFMTSAGLADVFVAKYEVAINKWVWAKRMGGEFYDEGTDVAVGNDGGVIVTGAFRGTANILGKSKGEEDIFLARFVSTGEITWLKREGGDNNESDPKLGIDANNNIYLTGVFYGNHFTTISNSIFAGKPAYDFFIAKYNSDGVNQWVQQIGDGEEEFPVNLSVGANNNVYITGWFENAFQMGNNSLKSAGDTDIFITRIKD